MAPVSPGLSEQLSGPKFFAVTPIDSCQKQNARVKRTLMALVVTVALAAGACSLTSGRRPVAAPGRIVTVGRKAPRAGMGVLDPDTRLHSIFRGLALRSS